MFNFKSEPIDKQSILEDGFELYKQTFRLSLPYSVTIACFSSLPLLFLLSPAWPHAGLLLATLLSLIIAFTLSAAFLFHLYCFCYSVPSNITTALKQAFIKLPTLLYLIAVYVIIVLSGTMLLIVPGIIVAFSLIFSFFLVLTDNQTMLQSLISSHRLVWGNWWHCFLTISFPLLLNTVLALACFITVTEVAINAKLSMMSAALILATFNIIVQALVLPLVLSVLLVLLHDLRQRKALQTPSWN